MASIISLGRTNGRRGRTGQLVTIALALGLSACADDTPSKVVGSASGTDSTADSAGQGDPDNGSGVIVRVPLSFAGGGWGGIAGQGGSSSGGTSSGGTATAGTAGTALPPLVSSFCGDSIRNAAKEECDSGATGAAGYPQMCNWGCQIVDVPAQRQSTPIPANSRLLRRLGRGRHPLAANDANFAVVTVETTTSSSAPIVALSTYDEFGRPIVAADVGQGSLLMDEPDPVVASLGTGDYAVAYTDFNGDGDGLGVALRRLRAGQVSPDAVQVASYPGFAGQYDPDILALGDRVLVAYTDEYDAVSAPDVKVREFTLGLLPTGAETMLGNSSDFEGRVALAKLGNSWGAAWRTGHPDGTESIEIYDAGTQVRWKIDLATGGPVDDHPSIVELNATQRLVLYTISRDPDGDGSSGTGEMQIAVVDTTQPGTAIGAGTLYPTSSSTAWANQGTRRPGLVKIGDYIYVTWTSYSTAAASTEDAGLEQITVSVVNGALKVGLGGQLTLPRWPAELTGDQRFPALAAMAPSRRYPSGALVGAWESYNPIQGFNLGGEPEVQLELAPLPLRRDATRVSDCTTASPCTAGTGRCTQNNQCVAPLVCSTSKGRFNYAPNVGVCVAAHCNDGMFSWSETGIDCGGPDCGTCKCGDGIVSLQLGEVCDPGTYMGYTGYTESCDSDCTIAECGDGVINSAYGEECEPPGFVDPYQGVCTSGCSWDNSGVE